MKRVIFDILIFISVFVLPWWITVPLAFVGIFLFVEYYEFILIGVILYSLYMVEGMKILSSPFIYSVIISVIFLGVQALRHYIILYKNEISH